MLKAEGSRHDTGVFAYNFVPRGFNYGLRIVGTLKSGPDVNVLCDLRGTDGVVGGNGKLLRRQDSLHSN